MTITYHLDTNAGPILTIDKRDAAAMRAYVERNVPLLQRRGYTRSWTRSGRWHVMAVANSRGTVVHRCAFRPKRKGER